ncbi:MAG: ribosome-associated translation inhibitor RaiA [Defluviitaleaceae bacterium]|nr:ribosome-associated translation inhibitor RaiA [Defluviitaleaceae bacterium]
MRFTFTGKNLVVSQDMKDKTEQKMGRLSRLFPESTEVFVAFSVVRADNKVEVSIPLTNKRMLRAEVTAPDMYAAIDGAVDVLDKQMVKYKKRLIDRSRRDASFKGELDMINFSDNEPTMVEDEGKHEIIIERRKHFPLKPMDVEEAVMSMEMLGHNFFVFRNSATDEINVVYKRNQGTYGLIDPNDPVDDD